MITNPLKRILTYFFAFVITPACLFFMYVRRASRGGLPPRILLFPYFTRIGDYICEAVVISAIKRHIPNAYIAVVVTDRIKELALYNPDIDDVIVYKNGRLFTYFTSLFRGRYDVSFSMAGTLLSNLTAWFACVPKRYTIVYPNQSFVIRCIQWMHTGITQIKKGEYLPHRYLSMLEYIGINERTVEKKVYVPSDAVEHVDVLWEDFCLPHNALIVGISISAGNTLKEWGDKNFVSVVQALLKNKRVHIIVIGTATEAERISRFIDVVKNTRVHSAIGTSLAYVPEIIRRFHLFVSVDTGPMHIADALKVPLVDIIGPVIDGELTPRGDHVRIVHPRPYVEPTIFSTTPQGDPKLTEKALIQTRVKDVLAACHSLESRL